LFHPVKPMLAGKRSIEEIKQILFGKTISIEIKYDGERIQCHFNKDQLKFFTRQTLFKNLLNKNLLNFQEIQMITLIFMEANYQTLFVTI